MFLGRKNELLLLGQLWEAEKAKLVVCQGRRRIGKSTLIKEFSKTSRHFFSFQGLAPRAHQKEHNQLKHFYAELNQYADVREPANASWPMAFSDLAKAIGSQKKVLIFLDEISWMAQHSPDFAGYLKIAWDNLFSKKNNLILVLCGSVSTWIEENILSSTGFVGRVSLSIGLDELSLIDSVQLLSNKNEYEKIRTLCLTGGVPKYLEEFNGKLSLRENTQRLFFSKEGFLFKDFDRIFNDIFLKKSDTYREIAQTLIEKRKTISEIAKSLKIKRGGLLGKYLRDLVLSGFLAEDFLYSPGGKKNKTSYFRIKDNYLRFYLKYIYPKKVQIESHQPFRSGVESLPGWESILGLQFENLILNNKELIFKSLRVDPSHVKSASSYFQKKTVRNRGACQIDLLIETNGFELIICEIKQRQNLSTSIIKEIESKKKLLKRPRHYTVRTALIYFGELRNPEDFKSKIDFLISIEEMLSL